ncbi:MAG: hypothetical protein ACJ8FY_01895 [Gemmataceae bacterium]
MSAEVLKREPGESAQHWYDRLMGMDLWEDPLAREEPILELIARLRRQAARLAKDEEKAWVA